MQQSALLAALENVDWDQLATLHGSAEQVPDWILQLASEDPAWRVEGLQALWQACSPEAPVTLHVIPFLLALLRDPSTEDKDELLHLLASFVPIGNPAAAAHEPLAAALTDACLPFLESDDPALREAAFALAARFPEHYTHIGPLLWSAAEQETNPDALTRMLESFTRFATAAASDDASILPEAAAWITGFVDSHFPPVVRFHAALYAARWLGPQMPPPVVEVLGEAAAKPSAFAKYRSDLLYGPIVEQACDNLYHLPPDEALPQFVRLLKATKDPEDAHTIAGYLLATAFPGLPKRPRYGALPPDYSADRPDNTSVKFRAWRATPEQIARKRSRGRLYTPAPARLVAAPFSAAQRVALEAIVSNKLIWMLHSNLLETVGLPAHRDEAEAYLKKNRHR